MYLEKAKKENMLKRNLIIFTIILSSFFLDLITKNYAINNLIFSDSLIINNFLKFTLVFNEGAAFSILSDAGGWQRWFFIIFTFFIILIITFILLFEKDSEYIAFSLILGGALGNLYDRIILGYVIDFIEIYYKNFSWPIFNIADISISLGLILLLYSMLFKCKKNK